MLTCRCVRRFAIRSAWTLTTVTLISLLPASAAAQNAAPPGKWTVELYGGGSSSGSISGTPIATFPAGTPFTLSSGQPGRAVPSWFFGDGAILLNQVLTQFAASANTTFPRIAPLDEALRAGGGKQPSGGVVGLRLGRVLTPKFSVEFSVERSPEKVGMNDSLLDALEASGESFEDAFQALLNTLPVTNLVVTSAVTRPIASNTQTRIAGALKWTVFSRGTIEAYLTGGGGLIMNSAEDHQATVDGRYTFSLFGQFPLDELDRVVVTLNRQKNSVMGLVGGGVTYDVMPDLGLRADVRLTLSPSKDDTTLTTSPDVTAQFPPVVLSTPAGISPGLQFSTQPGVRSTLGGPNANLTVFTGSGLNRQVAFTLGMFVRF